MTDHGIDLQFTAAYSPQTNGITERFNKTLGDTIALLLKEAPVGKEWDDTVGQACAIINATPRESLGGMSPFFLCHGWEYQGPLERLAGQSTVTSIDAVIPNSTTANIEKARQGREQVGMHLYRDSWRDARDGEANKTILQIGSMVFKKRMSIRSKFDDRWDGPFAVTELHPGGRSVSLDDGTKYRYRIDQIKVWNPKNNNDRDKNIVDNNEKDSDNEEDNEDNKAANTVTAELPRSLSSLTPAAPATVDQTNKSSAKEKEHVKKTKQNTNYEVKRIIDYEKRGNQHWYRLTWKYYRGKDWLPLENLNCSKLIDEYWHEKGKERPHSISEHN